VLDFSRHASRLLGNPLIAGNLHIQSNLTLRPRPDVRPRMHSASRNLHPECTKNLLVVNHGRLIWVQLMYCSKGFLLDDRVISTPRHAGAR
jgi:hypothetical protein